MVVGLMTVVFSLLAYHPWPRLSIEELHDDSHMRYFKMVRSGRVMHGCVAKHARCTQKI